MIPVEEEDHSPAAEAKKDTEVDTGL